VKFTAERTAYETQISVLQQQLVDSENQIEILMTENERQKTFTKERKNMHGKSEENYILEISELKNQLETFKSNNFVSEDETTLLIKNIGYKTTCNKI